MPPTISRKKRQYPDKGVIYFVICPFCHAVKIGKCYSNIYKRVAQMQGQSPADLRLVGIIETDNASEEERRIHELLHEHAMHGEWFYMDEEVMTWIAINVKYTPYSHYVTPSTEKRIINGFSKWYD